MTRTRPFKRLVRTKTALLIAVAFALAVIAAAGVVTSSPKACASCHAMKPYVDTLASSAHAHVHCYRCHVSGGVWGVPREKAIEWGPMVAGAVSGVSTPTSGDPVSSTRCLDCHDTVMRGVLTANGTRIDHSKCVQPPAQCTDCHSLTAHGPAVSWRTGPVMEECVLCHRSEGAPTACNTCHEGKRAQDRLAVGPWQVTHGKQWKSTHGQGNLQYCSTCHPDNYCVDCHGTALPHGADFGRTHGGQAKLPQAKCTTCHAKPLCDSCHGIVMPHPAAFLKVHSKEAKKLGRTRCLRCHEQGDCDGCHAAHVHPGRTDGTLGKGPDGVIALPRIKGGGN